MGVDRMWTLLLASQAPIRSLTTTASSLIVKNGGVLRTFDFWGKRPLPQPFYRGQDEQKAVNGVYWTMRFDANPPTVAALNDRLRLDPRVMRWTVLKLGSTLDQVTSPRQDPTVKLNRLAVRDTIEEEIARRRLPPQEREQSHSRPRFSTLPGR
ncbi:hypothetical protein OIV83_004536 [Microbotryomycetes sp. JL201]|nr:hypothetical protein OIV83_004536 [Microbotryomycetes sp. JL201]